MKLKVLIFTTLAFLATQINAISIKNLTPYTCKIAKNFENAYKKFEKSEELQEEDLIYIKPNETLNLDNKKNPAFDLNVKSMDETQNIQVSALIGFNNSKLAETNFPSTIVLPEKKAQITIKQISNKIAFLIKEESDNQNCQVDFFFSEEIFPIRPNNFLIDLISSKKVLMGLGVSILGYCLWKYSSKDNKEENK